MLLALPDFTPAITAAVSAIFLKLPKVCGHIKNKGAGCTTGGFDPREQNLTPGHGLGPQAPAPARVACQHILTLLDPPGRGGPMVGLGA